MDQADSTEMVTQANRGENDLNASQTNKTKERKRQRDYYIKTKSKRRCAESDCEPDEPNVQSDTNLFTTAQIESIRDIVFEYMTTDFEKDKPSSNNTLMSGALCAMGAFGIGSKVLQNREAIGALVSDFLGRLGQPAPVLPIKSIDGEETRCASGLALPQLTHLPPSQSSDSVDSTDFTLVKSADC